MKIQRLTKAVSLRRSVEQGTEEQRKTVQEILAAVRSEKDIAIKRYTQKFDGVTIGNLAVSDEEMRHAYKQIDEEAITVIRQAAQNIRKFHEQQKRVSWMTTETDGSILGQKITPLDAVGVYVPGGTAPLASSVLMNVIPALVAGVKRIVMVTPPQKTGEVDPSILVAAKEAGVEELYKVGGAQAIGALAYGTETIQPVDKIVGPGNIYVALAKREVFGDVAIDMIAGPSEIVVLADDTAYPDEVAADLLSQAEHDPRASSILVTTSQSLAEKVAKEVERQVAELPRADIARASLAAYGAIYVADSLEEAVDAVNELAPEHVELLVENAFGLIGSIRHAGAIFVGRFSSESVGDYFAGPNHVLPTNGTARFSSPLNVDDFIKKSSIIAYSEKALTQNFEAIATFARQEQLEAHARAVESRFWKKEERS
ncbi:histidinol dehydrogenase [Bacillus fonticola]|uniref:histidinol dehydrogenase n=1 Tax=Bacillus fonticola TaxID=2728853 RepID=UPI001474F81E|nr:histidinol dehydrogenase [Bacillus fonticola]